MFTKNGRINGLFLGTVGIILVVAALALAQSFYLLDPGFAAIHLRLGKIIKTETESGLYFKLPVIDSVSYLDTRIKKATIETSALSKDLQGVDVGMVVNYRILDAAQLYKNIGINFESVIIDPFAQEDVKAVVAQYNAENLIQKRQEAKEFVIEQLRARLATKYIQLVDFNFTHLDFSKDFIHAVEAKQIAEQSAKQAENLTKKIKEEAVQTKTRAEAEAFSLKVKRESVTQELIELKKVEAQLLAIEKWNGQLPRFVSGTTPLMPFLNEGSM